jgi:hypothetical protein
MIQRMYTVMMYSTEVFPLSLLLHIFKSTYSLSRIQRDNAI